ncbi:uncharacterized protein LOC119578140 [Penaeus monodon]|uniref:uncharacterized protein LOC119578140 n=1 Tax=Penaeus monodon TaxID=6687 RepID=UPI0018A7B659|nr:uncharacterized protein LOC119578140 [Penaeus monodon]
MNQLDQDEKLIIEVQQYPGLYDQNSYDYRDLRKKENMWQKVADALGLHARECQARWRVLRDKFVREMRKNMNPKKAGSSALQVYQGSWPLMSQLMFLTSHVKHRPYRPGKRDTFSDAGGTEDEEEGEASDEDEADMKHPPAAFTYNLTPPPCPTTPPSSKRMKLGSCDADAPRLAAVSSHGALDGDLLRVLATLQGARHDDEQNSERLFCLSLVPVLKRLEPEKRSVAKLQIQKVLHNLEFPQIKFEI